MTITPRTGQRSALVAAALVGVVVTVTTSVSPAEAERVTYRNTAHDVVTFGPHDGTAPRPGVENGDVRRVKVAHTARTVVVAVKFTDLAKDVDSLGQFVTIKTPDGTASVVVGAQPGRWTGKRSFDGVAGPRGCARAEHKLNYRADRFRLTIPRSCLDAPRWVRVGVGTTTVMGDRERVDDSRRNGAIQDRLALTSRLTRG